MTEGATTPEGITPYSFGGFIWDRNNDNQAWQFVSSTDPSVGAGAGAIAGDPFAYRPQEAWQARWMKEHTDEDIYNPVKFGSRMAGYDPAMGQYLLSGSPFSFNQFLNTTYGQGEFDRLARWEDLKAVSAGFGAAPGQEFTGPQFGQQSFLRQGMPTVGGGGMSADQVAVEMVLAAMGASEGVAAEARRRELRRRQELYAAQAALTQQPTGTWISDIGKVLNLTP